MAKKPSLGRQKIEIKRIEKEDSRQVCFSKRRAGAFKKASELCILCGVEIAIIVFTPAGKPSSIGHPSVDSVVNRYHYCNTPSFNLGSKNNFSNGTLRMNRLCELNQQCSELLNQVEAEKNRRIVINKAVKAGKGDRFFWAQEIGEFALNDLRDLKASMENLRAGVVKRADEILKV
ncbi:agamous-like MADS-box protein AGL61 [Tasmannia lanceolata]|uniref:agamous-like MADS-box protein AGL61 n=1 Tax=Tasmannia lanceolata TaxID=3420 RepID=UPI00406357AC